MVYCGPFGDLLKAACIFVLNQSLDLMGEENKLPQPGFFTHITSFISRPNIFFKINIKGMPTNRLTDMIS